MSDKGKGKRVTNDERFSSVHNDPRFRMPKRNDFKVKLDDRFKASDLKSLERRAKIDKYGRKIKKDDNTADFKKFYETKDESDEESNSDEEESEEEKVEVDSEEDDEEEEEEQSIVADRARGVNTNAESSGDESSSDESSSEEEETDVESDMEVEQSKPEAGEPERRFAVVNLDWDHVKSTDLMATFHSFVPVGGLIESVYVYPSEFGKERLQKEEIEGPPRDLFKSKKSKKKDQDSDDSDSEIEAKDLYEEDDGKEDYNSKSLRRYQLQRLRYYYAVVTCDSIKTAKAIYDNCDGTEYEFTANFFDLRFIPDEMEFDDKPRDFCNKIPSNYQPVSFVTDALQHSKVKLTWDETPAERVKMSSKSFSQRELDDMDFKAYLASDNSDEEDELVSQDLKNKYRNLVGASTKIGDKGLFSKDNGKDDIDMEITFTPGLDAEEQAPAPKKPDEESTIEKLKRKSRERRKARKDKIKGIKKGQDKLESDDEAEEEEEEEVEKKEVSKKSKSKKNKSDKSKDKQASEKSKAELELLMLDEDKESKAQHFNMKELVRSEKEKSKKSKHRNKDKIIEDNFQADLNDPRFNEIFTNHDFAIDPSQPQFKNTSTMKKILEERNKRRDDETPEKKTKESKKRKLETVSKDENFDVKSLVQKLKRKAQK